MYCIERGRGNVTNYIQTGSGFSCQVFILNNHNYKSQGQPGRHASAAIVDGMAVFTKSICLILFWITITYKPLFGRTGINGWFSGPFKVSGSVRQGFPFSPELFNLDLEMLAIVPRSTIKGYK